MIDPSEFESVDELDEYNYPEGLELEFEDFEGLLTLEDVQEVESFFENDINL
jgi:hypothetical protein